MLFGIHSKNVDLVQIRFLGKRLERKIVVWLPAVPLLAATLLNYQSEHFKHLNQGLLVFLSAGQQPPPPPPSCPPSRRWIPDERKPKPSSAIIESLKRVGATLEVSVSA